MNKCDQYVGVGPGDMIPFGWAQNFSLHSKKEDDEWLLEVLDEAVKGVAFHEQQLQLWGDFQGRVHAYVEEVRQEANQLAITGG